MNNYSIVRVGHEYVVRADKQSILKIASRRRAARLVTDAAELLDMQLQSDALSEPSASDAPLQPHDEASIDADPSKASKASSEAPSKASCKAP
jgi:hypothetical protein